jgi:hypothetical protein
MNSCFHYCVLWTHVWPSLTSIQFFSLITCKKNIVLVTISFLVGGLKWKSYQSQETHWPCNTSLATSDNSIGFPTYIVPTTDVGTSLSFIYLFNKKTRGSTISNLNFLEFQHLKNQVCKKYILCFAFVIVTQWFSILNKMSTNINNFFLCFLHLDLPFVNYFVLNISHNRYDICIHVCVCIYICINVCVYIYICIFIIGNQFSRAVHSLNQ